MLNRQPVEVVVGTYNALCDEYVARNAYLKSVPEHHRNREVRYPRIVQKACALNVDVLCMQEVDYQLFAMLDAGLSKIGYVGRWSHKGRQKPDGLAIFARRQIDCRQTDTIVLAGEKNVAQIAHLYVGDFRLGVANCHLVWDKPGTTPVAATGHAQAQEVVRAARRFAGKVVVCGDFNAKWSDPPLRAFADDRYVNAHPDDVMTNASDVGPLRLDHILCPVGMEAEPIMDHTPVIDATTLFPDDDNPSDHLPLIARLREVR